MLIFGLRIANIGIINKHQTLHMPQNPNTLSPQPLHPINADYSADPQILKNEPCLELQLLITEQHIRQLVEAQWDFNGYEEFVEVLLVESFYQVLDWTPVVELQALGLVWVWVLRLVKGLRRAGALGFLDLADQLIAIPIVQSIDEIIPNLTATSILIPNPTVMPIPGILSPGINLLHKLPITNHILVLVLTSASLAPTLPIPITLMINRIGLQGWLFALLLRNVLELFRVGMGDGLGAGDQQLVDLLWGTWGQWGLLRRCGRQLLFYY